MTSASSQSSSSTTHSSHHCANCDECLTLSTSFDCAHCVGDLTPACIECCLAIHEPLKLKYHHLTRRTHSREQQQHQQQNEFGADNEEGFGFCDHCRSLYVANPSHDVQLAVLKCEQCTRSRGSSATSSDNTGYSLCLACDQSLHSSLDMDSHTRLLLDNEDATSPSTSSQLHTRKKQSELYSLAEISGLQIQHLDSLESYSGRIWPGSMLLARYCEQMEQKNKKSAVTPGSGYWSSKRVLELGCGCAAIPGLTAYLLGASSVVCTDMNTDGLEILRENITGIEKQLKERNIGSAARASIPSSSEGMTTRELRFGDESVASELAGKFDVILGSYILYDPDSFALLARTLNILVLKDSKTLTILTSHEPTREMTFLDSLTQHGFTYRRELFTLQSAGVNQDQHADCGSAARNTTKSDGEERDEKKHLGLRSTSILLISRVALDDVTNEA